MKKNKNIFGTKEWAEKTFNCSNGCSNNCKYCYAKSMAIRFGRKTKSNWSDEEIFLSKAKKAATCRRASSYMFPSTHDITPATLETCLQAVRMVLDNTAGHRLLIVSKPRFECIQRLCTELQEYKDRVLFRFTIGSADNEILKFWEPDAPSFKERLESLQLAFSVGYQTSISCEPMLDDKVEMVIEKVSPFVTDAIWIGKANMLKQRLTVNGENDWGTQNKAAELIRSQSGRNIKRLYQRLKDNPIIKWKESIKDEVGIPRAINAGMDI